MNTKEGTLWRLRKHWVPLWNRNLPLRSLCHWRVLNMFYTSRLGKGRKDRCSDIQLSFYKVSPSTETFLKNQKQKITVSSSHFQFIFVKTIEWYGNICSEEKNVSCFCFVFFKFWKYFCYQKLSLFLIYIIVALEPTCFFARDVRQFSTTFISSFHQTLKVISFY